jgi:hypothetical protein
MNQRGFAAFGLIIILVAIVAGVAGWWYLEGNPAVSTSPATTGLSVLEANTHTDWQIYTNAEFGFSISHPKSVTPAIRQIGADYLEVSVSPIFITVWKKPDASSDDLFTGPYPRTITSTISSRTVVQRTLNGLKGVELYGAGSEGHSYDDTFLYRDKYVWSVTLDPIIEGRITAKDWYAEGPPPANDKAIYKQMRDSFRVL